MKYGAQFVWIDEDDNAKGTFFLGITSDGNATYVRDSTAAAIAPISRIPMQVTVLTGRCCNDPGAVLLCSDNVLFDECGAGGGDFLPGESCSGVDVDPVDGLDDSCPIVLACGTPGTGSCCSANGTG